MRTDSPTYTLAFAAVVCVVCSLCVAAAHVLLKGQQMLAKTAYLQTTVLLEVAGLVKPDAPGNPDRAAILAQRIQARLVDLQTGEYVEDPSIDPLRYDQRAARNDPGRSKPAPENASEITRIPNIALVYVRVDEAGQPEQMVLPIEGNGLYGTIYGLIAIDRDGTTVRGIAFHEHSETPGLGSEIAAPKWRAEWLGRKLFDEDWELAMEVVKRGGGPVDTDPHRINAITGATISSFAVEDMLIFWLNEHGFGPYLARMRAALGTDAAQPAAEVTSEKAP